MTTRVKQRPSPWMAQHGDRLSVDDADTGAISAYQLFEDGHGGQADTQEG